MRDIVWVVLSQDRQLIQVCSSSDYAKDQAKAMKGVYESWPVEHSALVRDWNMAIRAGVEFRATVNLEPPGPIV